MSAVDAAAGVETTHGAVQPKCDDKTTPGYWLCVTHDKTFPHNLSMTSHTVNGKHVLAWVCGIHGPEVP